MLHRKLILIILFTAAFSNLTFAAFKDDFYAKTLRLDYLHTGNYARGNITFMRWLSEPYWGGSATHLIDTFGYGRYYFELRDAATQKVLYSRGFSTLFVEWQDTEEAKTGTRSFKESLVMPYPKKKAVVEIFSRDKQNKLHSLFVTDIDPLDAAIVQQKKLPYATREITVNQDPSRALDIVFIGDGYTEAEIDTFWADCSRFAGYLLGAAPFRQNQVRVNIRGIAAISEDQGVSLPGKGIYKKTAVGASFYTFGSERYLMVEDFQRIRDVASLVPYDQIFVIANSNKYGGGGIYNFYSTGTRGNEEASFLLIHEFGHSFAGLADEYYTSEVAVDAFYDLQTEPWEPNITTLVDFDKKWADMVPLGTEIPTPFRPGQEATVGVYEGAGYSAEGIYRPFPDCTMKSVKYDAFCPVCQRAITRMLWFYSEP